VLTLPLGKLSVDVLEVLGGTGDLLGLATRLLILDDLLATLLKNVDDLELDESGNLRSANSDQQYTTVTHKSGGSNDANLDLHGLGQRVLAAVEGREQLGVAKVVDVELRSASWDEVSSPP
jgi:hypothetical protein